jgi:Tfp pilus assembly protein PilX
MTVIPNPLRQHTRPLRPVSSERGQTLMLALIVMLVLSISAATAAQLMTSHQNVSSNERQGVQAFTGGESGLDLAANSVTTNDTGGASAVNTVLSGSANVAGSTVAWTATKSATSQWTLKSTTTSPNGKTVRKLQEEMQSTTIPGQPATIWKYGFVMGNAAPASPLSEAAACEAATLPVTSTFFGGSGSISVPTWINGDFCDSGGSNPAIGNPTGCSNPVGTSPVPACAIPVHISGTMYAMKGPTYVVGTDTNQVASAFITICWNFHAGANVPCDSNLVNANSGGSGVYASTFTPVEPTPTPTKQTLTSAQEQGFWSTASPGPNNACGAGSTGTPPANLFDNNAGTTSGPDTSLGSKDFVTLLGGTAFDCVTATGELKWTPGALGLLKVTGTVFFDASLTMSGADYIKWDPASNGSIYVDGTITFLNGSFICAIASGSTCNPGTDGWTPAAGPFVFMAAYNRAGARFGFDFPQPGNGKFEGDAYANGGFELNAGASFAGSIFADFGDVEGAGAFGVSSVPPQGSLGSQSATTAWVVAPRTWRQCSVAGCT